ncbi:MAG: nitroreductase family protein [SAR202 cluster bacterium]|nr:nitroreductase family protein [SAR202 cluster bacterium]MDP6514577.1 nitroreductase family protein [SAR202 cluster bacterium]MDP6716077.1 nitroreductase family protein [SAR202 cluster bacterium]
MDVFNTIRTRRTVRDFKPDPVPSEIVHKLLQTARWSPSSSNNQPWHFVAVQDRETIKKLGEIATQGPFIADAPLIIVVVMDGAFRPTLDAGRAIQQMELYAWSEGMGTCFIGFREVDQQRQVKELLDIPQEMELITTLPFGYRAEKPKGQGVPRKPLSEIAHSERFGNGYDGG